MQKRVKITLYVILILVIIAVVRLMFGNSKSTTKNTENIQLSSEETTELSSGIESENLATESDSFEEDVMKDLEGFFGTNNGYEDVEGEYGFNNPEDE